MSESRLCEHGVAGCRGFCQECRLDRRITRNPEGLKASGTIPSEGKKLPCGCFYGDGNFAGICYNPEHRNRLELPGKGDKPTNPKDVIGSDKLPLDLWPAGATAMGCLGLLEGALKYGRCNWREIGVKSSIYVDACKRHLDAWYEGEENAPDSGVPHLANALACIAIIVDAQASGTLNDDRNYKGYGYRALVERLTPHVRRLKALFKDRNPRQYTIADNLPEGSMRCSSTS